MLSSSRSLTAAPPSHNGDDDDDDYYEEDEVVIGCITVKETLELFDHFRFAMMNLCSDFL